MSPEVDTPLFAGYEPAPTEPTEQLSAGQRLTRRQAQNIAAGIHPLTRGKLHPLASKARDAESPKRDPFTCGSCYFRTLLDHHNRTYAKCFHPGNRSGEEYEKYGPPNRTNGPASDVRAWWPACDNYSPGDLLSADAARHIPD